MRYDWSETTKTKLRLYLPASLQHVLFGPARRPLKCRYARSMGLFQSHKMGMGMAWESPVERDYMFLLEADPNVLAFVSQPVRLDIVIDGSSRHHYPDFLVAYDGTSVCLAEVKQDKEAALEATQKMFAAAHIACEQLGVTYREILATKVRREPNFKAAKDYCRERQLGLLPLSSVTSVC